MNRMTKLVLIALVMVLLFVAITPAVTPPVEAKRTGPGYTSPPACMSDKDRGAAPRIVGPVRPSGSVTLPRPTR